MLVVLLNFIKQCVKKTIFLFRGVDLASNIGFSPLSKLLGDKDFLIVKSDLSANTSFESGLRLYQALLIGKVKLGHNVSIFGPSTVLNAGTSSIEIGSYSSIAPGVKIVAYSHALERGTSYFLNKNVFGGSLEDDILSSQGIHLKEDVWVGANSVIVDGVTIGRGSVIAAGSVVTQDIPPYSIAGGVPARILRSRFTEERIKELERSSWWLSTGLELRAHYDLLMKENRVD